MAFSRIYLALCVLAFNIAGSRHALSNDGDPKFEIEFGDVPHYVDEASAMDACKPDAVIWADRKTGFFLSEILRRIRQDSIRVLHLLQAGGEGRLLEPCANAGTRPEGPRLSAVFLRSLLLTPAPEHKVPG